MKLTVRFLSLFGFPPCESLWDSSHIQQRREEGENKDALNDGHFMETLGPPNLPS